MKLTTVNGGEVISVKDFDPTEGRDLSGTLTYTLPKVIEVQSEEDVGPLTEDMV